MGSFGSALRSAFSKVGVNFFYGYIVNNELAFQQLMPIDVRRNVRNFQGAQFALGISRRGKARRPKAGSFPSQRFELAIGSEGSADFFG